LPKQRGRFSLELEPTRDILASLTNKPNDCLVVGFAAETHELAASAERKLREKNCDLIIANDVSRADVGMDAEENEVTIFSPNDPPKKIPRAKKSELARVLLKIILNAREKRLTKKS
jgi:phosphopantothenoylcysteine decarboxylase/phosphopantothenate--cysteine ligase